MKIKCTHFFKNLALHSHTRITYLKFYHLKRHMQTLLPKENPLGISL